MAGLEDTVSFYERVSKKLPPTKFTFHHISTPPTKCDPLYAPPPGSKPERTYCESHFLTVSAPRNGRPVLVFAIEVLIFTTKRLTTIFVSKADSTGCLASVKTTSGASGSVVRTVASEFVSWLVEHRQRPQTRLVLSLFARAQGQYLFPASVDNKGKHVLDDRQLVRWWCKTLDPVLRRESLSISAQAYVIVPGFDRQETTSFFPPSYRADPPERRKWVFGHPLQELSAHPLAPPRCLVPRFPDDPKARYLDELDEEIPDSAGTKHLSSPSKKGSGMWKSIKTLSQFWEMMAFRQECSSGRMVGFIWVVFTPDDVDVQDAADGDILDSPGSPTPTDLPAIAEVLSTESKRNKSESKERPKKVLTGPVIPRAPRVKQTSSTSPSLALTAESPHWRWPESSRGQVVLDPVLYLRIHDLLLKLDFSNDEAATESTTKWLEEAATIVGDLAQWGCDVLGTAEPAHIQANITAAGSASRQGCPITCAGVYADDINSQPNDLSASIVRKKRKADAPPDEPSSTNAPTVNMLSSGLIRKKAKT